MSNHAPFTFFGKALAEQSRAPSNHESNHAIHVFDDSAGRAITEAITAIHAQGNHETHWVRSTQGSVAALRWRTQTSKPEWFAMESRRWLG